MLFGSIGSGIFMGVASAGLGYYLMPAILGFDSPLIQNNFTKIWSAILMAGSMILVEGLMWVDLRLIVVGLVIAFLGYRALRSQLFVTPKDFLSGMIEHHGMAIVMSEKLLEKKSSLTSVPAKKVANLANRILRVQESEIAEMINLRYQL